MDEIHWIRDVLLPTAILGVIAWCVPKLFAQYLAETIPALWMNALLSTVVMLWVGALYFAVPYLLSRAGLAQWIVILPAVLAQSAKFALIWAPIGILSLVSLPEKWTLDE